MYYYRDWGIGLAIFMFLLMIGLYVLTIYIAYRIVRRAVKMGMLDADDERARRISAHPQYSHPGAHQAPQQMPPPAQPMQAQQPPQTAVPPVPPSESNTQLPD